MKKLLLAIAAVAMLLPSCKKINEAIDDLNNRVTELENTAIPTINEQIANINTSIADLEAADVELKNYITALQSTAADLQKSIDATNTKIDNVKTALQGEISTAKADVLAQLEALRTETNNELSQINSTIATLQAKDTELKGKITELRNYVDTELKNTEDWATATFSTLEQYNALCTEIATIKTQIENLNKSISELETRLTTKINEDIATAVSTLNADIQQKVSEITTAYTNAVKIAKEEITSAYTTAIQNAINALDASLKSWVGEQLSNYYTIAEVNAKISALQTAITDGDVSLQEELSKLKSQLETTATEITAAYKKAIEEAINTNNGVIDTKIANEIASVNQRIANEVATINAKIAEIESRLDNVEAKIAELLARIQSLSFVPEFSDCKATMYYTESNGTITAGSATLKYEVRPAAVAEELVAVWEEALSVKAVYAQTRATVGEFVNLTVESASAKDGILTVVAKGANLEEGFFRNEISANVRLEVSNGYNCLTSDYVNMVPWTTNTVYVPDVNFKAYLVEKFDTDSDSEISLAEAENITEIDIMGLMPQATSLAGIEYFTNLEKLNCSFNRLRSLDLSNNKKLTEINANNNRLSSIDVSDNASLVKFYCNKNQLRKIDVTANAALQEFDIANNLLLTLNIRNNTALTYLNISNNAEISVVDTKNNTLLEVLVASGLAITDIDLTSNTALKGVELFNANLSSTKKLDTTGLGVVYIEKTPYNAGKMVSVAEGSSLKWSTSGITTSAIDSDNGTTNMAIIKALSSWETKYPAFKWCSDYGTDWYLPAFNELYTIYNNKSTINSILSTNGYTAFGTEDYWSSTEYNSNNACGVNFSFGISDGYATKGYKISVRAVLAF